jgi:hypothetical protein
MYGVLMNLDGTRLDGLFLMYLNIRLSTRFFPLMVYHNYIEISEWKDNVVLLLSMQCLRFLSRWFIISAQTGHTFVHVSRIVLREVLLLIPLPVLKNLCKSHTKIWRKFFILRSHKPRGRCHSVCDFRDIYVFIRLGSTNPGCQFAVKAKFTLELVTEAQRRARGLAVLFL